MVSYIILMELMLLVLYVLILVVVEDGLVPVGRYAIDYDGES